MEVYREEKNPYVPGGIRGGRAVYSRRRAAIKGRREEKKSPMRNLYRHIPRVSSLIKPEIFLSFSLIEVVSPLYIIVCSGEMRKTRARAPPSFYPIYTHYTLHNIYILRSLSLFLCSIVVIVNRTRESDWYLSEKESSRVQSRFRNCR